MDATVGAELYASSTSYPDAATAAVERLVERETPLIWEVNGARRVLCPTLSMKDKTLLLHAAEAVLAEADS